MYGGKKFVPIIGVADLPSIIRDYDADERDQIPEHRDEESGTLER